MTSLRRYYRGHSLVAMRDVQAGQNRYFHFDHQGTTQALTDSTGAVTDRFASDAWGVQVKRTGSSINRQWYVGNLGYTRQVDQAIDHVRARWYRPNLGRWISTEPMEQPPGDYLYASSAPAASIDPSGLWTCRKLGGGRLVTAQHDDVLRVFYTPPGGGIANALRQVIRRLGDPPRDCVAINGTFFWVDTGHRPRVSIPFGTVRGYGGHYNAPDVIRSGRVRLIDRFYFGVDASERPRHGQGHPPAGLPHAAGGLGRLLDNGRLVPYAEMLRVGNFGVGQVGGARPRTAIGLRNGVTSLFATTSPTAMEDEGRFLKQVGFSYAYFADGGRSTEMWFSDHPQWNLPPQPAVNDPVIPQFFVLCQRIPGCAPPPDHREPGAPPC